MNDDGKSGFLITVVALLVAAGTFGYMAWTGTTGRILPLNIASLFLAAVGHFMLGGAEYRARMLEKRKK